MHKPWIDRIVVITSMYLHPTMRVGVSTNIQQSQLLAAKQERWASKCCANVRTAAAHR